MIKLACSSPSHWAEPGQDPGWRVRTCSAAGGLCSVGERTPRPGRRLLPTWWCGHSPPGGVSCLLGGAATVRRAASPAYSVVRSQPSRRALQAPPLRVSDVQAAWCGRGRPLQKGDLGWEGAQTAGPSLHSVAQNESPRLVGPVSSPCEVCPRLLAHTERGGERQI